MYFLVFSLIRCYIEHNLVVLPTGTPTLADFTLVFGIEIAP